MSKSSPFITQDRSGPAFKMIFKDFSDSPRGFLLLEIYRLALSLSD